ncbi:MAG: hypothetical protein HYZ00_12105 [Candidatus Hydrogenedentes bacterium]|nr:hypothetical protein [Candidatus Hydrogenedentota bacterium]
MKKNGKTEAAKKKAKGSKKAPAATLIQVWPTDPMGGAPPLQVTPPQLPGAPLSTRIVDPQQTPPPQIYLTGTAEFRYWTAAAVLRRAAQFWSSFGITAWHQNIPGALPVRLDDGVDLNAYYARDAYPPYNIKQGLSFFHDTVTDTSTGQHVMVYSGESPDVVSHELGHAVLDKLKPQLFSMTTTEAAAFHESFGDMSSILTALQLPQVRLAILGETSGHLWRNSSVSRLAEQLGWAIRQRYPFAVDADSLRNASNSFSYVDPASLPPDAPATQLSREPHNFSRVFTGAFLEALGGMVLTLADPPSETDVAQAAADMGRLLVAGIAAAPTNVQFFRAVAREMIAADAAIFNAKYGEALKRAFMRRKLLPLHAISAAASATATAASAASSVLTTVSLNGASVGMPGITIYAVAPAAQAMATGEAAGGVAVAYGETHAFIEQLVLRGRLAAEPQLAGAVALPFAAAPKRITHCMVRKDSGAELHRLGFECGCCP